MFNIRFHITYKVCDSWYEGLPPSVQEHGTELRDLAVHAVPCIGSTVHADVYDAAWEWKVLDVHYLIGSLTTVNQPINAPVVAHVHVLASSV